MKTMIVVFDVEAFEKDFAECINGKDFINLTYLNDFIRSNGSNLFDVYTLNDYIIYCNEEAINHDYSWLALVYIEQ